MTKTNRVEEEDGVVLLEAEVGEAAAPAERVAPQLWLKKIFSVLELEAKREHTNAVELMFVSGMLGSE